MKNISFYKGLLVGLSQSFILEFLIAFFCSEFFVKTALEKFLVIVVMSSFFSVILYVLLVYKETDNKKVVSLYVTSFLSFILIETILFLFNPFSFVLPYRKIGNADGLVIVMIMCIFIISTVILELCTLIVVIIKNRGQGDG